MTTESAPMPPWNGALRFAIELAALAGLAVGGAAVGSGTTHWFAAILLPTGAAASWGTFRVPDDPGPAPVPISGRLRLLIEAVLLGGATAGYLIGVGPGAGTVFLAITLGHYLLSIARIRWLLAR